MTQTMPRMKCWRCPGDSHYGHLNRWYCTACWQACKTISMRAKGES